MGNGKADNVTIGPEPYLRSAPASLNASGQIIRRSGPGIPLIFSVWRAPMAEDPYSGPDEEVILDAHLTSLYDSARGNVLNYSLPKDLNYSPAKGRYNSTAQADAGMIVKISPFPTTITMPILLKDAKAGTYKGFLLLSSVRCKEADQCGVTVIPVTVTLRAHWLGPLVVLSLSSIPLLAFTVYRRRRRQNDIQWVVLGASAEAAEGQTALVAPGGPAEPFRARLMALYDEAETNLNQSDTLPTSLTKAETIRALFAENPQGWVRRLDELAGARATLETRWRTATGTDPNYSIAAKHPSTLYEILTKLRDGAPDSPSYTDFAAKTITAVARVGQYDTFLNDVQQVIDDSTTTPANRLAALNLAQSWNAADPNATDFKQEDFRNKLEGLKPVAPAIAEGIPDDFSTRETASRIPPLSELYAANPVQPRNGLLSQGARMRVQAARSQTTFFANTAAVAIFILVVGLGFKETYLANATFGADGWADYIPLIAWGLGGNAAFQAAYAAITASGWDAT